MGSYRFGPFLLNRESRTLVRAGEPVQLTAKVLETLLVLVENRSRVLDKDELLATLWPDTVVEEANLAQNVSTLRKALGDNPRDRRYIATIPGRGYSFVAGVTETSNGTDPAAVGTPTAARPSTVWFAAIAILIPLTGLLALSFYRTAARNDSPALHPFPFTSLPGLEYQPAFSPDGRQLVYVASDGETDGSSIYVKLIGAGSTNQTHHRAGPIRLPRLVARRPLYRFLAKDRSRVRLLPGIGARRPGAAGHGRQPFPLLLGARLVS